MKKLITLTALTFSLISGLAFGAEPIHVYLIKKEAINTYYTDICDYNHKKIEERKTSEDKRLVQQRIIDAIPMGDDVLIKYHFEVYDSNDKIIQTF